MDVEQRIRNLETGLETLRESLDSHHDVSTQVGSMQRVVDGLVMNFNAIATLAGQAMETAGGLNGMVESLRSEVQDAGMRLDTIATRQPIALVVFGGNNGQIISGYGVDSVVRTGNGIYDVNLSENSDSQIFMCQAILATGIQTALRNQSTVAVGAFSPNNSRRLHIQAFAIQSGSDPILWDAAEVAAVVW